MNITWANRNSGVTFTTGTTTDGTTSTVTIGPTTIGTNGAVCGKCHEWFVFGNVSCNVDHFGACCHKYDTPAEAPPRSQRIARALRSLADSEIAKAFRE